MTDEPETQVAEPAGAGQAASTSGATRCRQEPRTGRRERGRGPRLPIEPPLVLEPRVDAGTRRLVAQPDLGLYLPVLALGIDEIARGRVAELEELDGLGRVADEAAQLLSGEFV